MLQEVQVSHDEPKNKGIIYIFGDKGVILEQIPKFCYFENVKI